jgi:replication-associated recombination protein RarA
MKTPIALTQKYRPHNIDELVLSPQHGLKPAINFLLNPYASNWLFSGKSGIGKTSLSLLMAHAAASAPHIHHLVGSDLDHHRVRDLENCCAHRPLFGQLHAIVVDDADAIPTGGQVRLLRALEHQENSVWLFSSNEDLSVFEDRFLSRIRQLPFSAHGLSKPASQWLSRITPELLCHNDFSRCARHLRSK